MWVSPTFRDWFTISTETVSALREELAAARAELASLKQSNTHLTFTNDWMRTQINTLQLERAALMEKAYNIRVPAPQFAKELSTPPANTEFSFEDLGDHIAAIQGLPTYDK